MVAELPLACSDEAAAVEFMERQRWAACPACPRCGDTDVYQMQSNQGGRQADFRWRCRGCKRQYTVRTGSVMEDSAVPVRHWCLAYWMACSSKKGMSAKQMQRLTGLSYKSALFLMHRVRFAMVETGGAPLRGTVEVDETYVGGKPRKANRVEDRVPAKRGRGTNKQPVVAMVERGGRVRTRVVANVTAANLREVMQTYVHPSACIVTDELSVYPSAARGFAQHRTVNYGCGGYSYTAADGFTSPPTVRRASFRWSSGPSTGSITTCRGSTCTATSLSGSLCTTHAAWTMARAWCWRSARARGSA